MLYVPLLSFWGRVPLLFWSILAGTLVTMGCAIAPDFTSFYGLRALMGITLTSGEVIGLSFIKDMFFFHQHARKIGIWAFLFVVAPYLAPLLANFIIAGTGDWRIVFWVVFAICVVDLLLILIFADETWYRRDIPISEQPERGNRFLRLVGIWQVQHHKKYFISLKDALLRLLAVFLKPIMIPSMIY
jgi:MFS family permease